MIASCPSCATRFEVADAKLGPAGRKVKCSKCGHVWLQRLDGSTEDIRPPPSLVELAAPAIDAVAPAGESVPGAELTEAQTESTAIPGPDERRRAAILAPQRRSGKQVVATLVVALAVLGLLGVLVMGWRSGALSKNPLVASMLGAVGQQSGPIAEGLGFENVTTQRRADGTDQVLVVAGEVINNASVVRAIPPLRGALLASDNRELQNWTFTASAERVEPGQRVRFETTLRGPSVDATEVKVTFAMPGG